MCVFFWGFALFFFSERGGEGGGFLGSVFWEGLAGGL